MAQLKFEIRKAAGVQHYFWRIVHGDDILARSETMFNKADARAAAHKMKYNTYEYKFEVITTTDVRYPYSWHAQAANGRLLVSSTDLYKYYWGADEAKDFVKDNAPGAEIIDLT